METKGTAQVMAEKNLGEEKAQRYHAELMAHRPFQYVHASTTLQITPQPPSFIHTHVPEAGRGIFFEARGGDAWANWDEMSWLALATLSQDARSRKRLPEKAGMSCYSFWVADVDYGTGPTHSNPRLLRKA